ncbi:hypothetical protein K8M07_11095 [Schnuerera sp. xch1]|uniref:hypothetical protein n=1 Tax=Schnuerera sp. xch1 TaxID=2874283 RepID=UPI001CC09DE6|nr:hypothetical protein [Schnuerera sp. xch1]MBZ2175783.1 hypothetical protein [Schnuerera sp. xch1]
MKKKYKLKVLNKENILELLGYEIPDKFTLDKLLKRETLIDIGLEETIIYNYDSVVSDRIENVEIDIENIIEARFFNKEKEIRIFRDEKEIDGTIFIEKSDSPYIERTVLLSSLYQKQSCAYKLDLKKYIDYDEDNQAYIRYTKPSKLYFKEGK